MRQSGVSGPLPVLVVLAPGEPARALLVSRAGSGFVPLRVSAEEPALPPEVAPAWAAARGWVGAMWQALPPMAPAPEAHGTAIAPAPGGVRVRFDDGAEATVAFDALRSPPPPGAWPPRLVAGGRWLVVPSGPAAVDLGDVRAEAPDAPAARERLWCGWLAAPAKPPAGVGLAALALAREAGLNRAQLAASALAMAAAARDGRLQSFEATLLALGHVGGAELGAAMALEARVHALAPADQRFAFDAVLTRATSALMLGDALADFAGGEPLAQYMARSGRLRVEAARTLTRGTGKLAPAVPPEAEPPPRPAAAAPTARPDAVPPDSIHSLIGAILKAEGDMTPEEVAEVLQAQRASRGAGKPVAFGEIAMERGMVTARQLQDAVMLQRRLAVPAGNPRPLGWYLIEQGVLKPSQVRHGLDLARTRGIPLGEALVELGYMSPALVEVFLGMQAREHGAGKPADPA